MISKSNRHSLLAPGGRRGRWSLGVSLAATSAVAAMLWPCQVSAQSAGMLMPAPAPQNLLSLSAEASAEVAQDRLSIVLAAQQEGTDASALQAKLREAMEAALARARPAMRDGALEVRTGQFNVSPRYSRKPSGESLITGWVGRAELVIEGTDTAAVSRLAGQLDMLVVQSMGFGLSRQAREQAEVGVAAEAIARFREQADRYAKAFGFGGYSLREVRVDAGTSSAPPMPMMRSAVAMSAVAEAKAQPVQAGKATVTVNVSGSVQLSPR